MLAERVLQLCCGLVGMARVETNLGILCRFVRDCSFDSFSGPTCTVAPPFGSAAVIRPPGGIHYDCCGLLKPSTKV